ncbi:MAG: YajQ family cyclic di-GMP-binding protein [Gammaproteobacteria bacterium]|nr:YajQ family cyclic di-GMP-binding protein [Gammaproteobacteria bacterium]NNL99678.1 YajQ family cyclic di-GMP-binding protein [Gammaproteobacteria bacterium]
MPSFDVVSEVDEHELANSVDQTRREIDNRFDFKGTAAAIELNEFEITLIGDMDFQLKQILDILQQKMSKRGIDITCLEPGEAAVSGSQARQTVTVRNGIDTETARKIVKLVKDMKTKLQAQIQQAQVRVTGKKRDDLQAAIQMLKSAGLPVPLQFTNFRD